MEKKSTVDSRQSTDDFFYILGPVYHPDIPLVLASASPRRAELLTRAGYQFDVVPADVDERQLPAEGPEEYVTRLALDKATAVASIHPDRVVVGADTVVLIDGAVLGKPRNAEEAGRMLQQLSGRTHEVVTGVALKLGDACLTAVDVSRVTLAGLDADVIWWYVRTGEPRDKAGAYGVQGIASRFVTRIEGSYTNVVGLPMARVDQLISQLAGRS